MNPIIAFSSEKYEIHLKLIGNKENMFYIYIFVGRSIFEAG